MLSLVVPWQQCEYSIHGVLYSVWYSWCLSYREPGFTVLQAAWYRGTGLSQHHNHHRPLWFWKGKDRHLNSACFYTLLKSRLFVISLKTVIMVSPPTTTTTPKDSLWHHSLLLLRLWLSLPAVSLCPLSVLAAMVTWIISLLSKTDVCDLMMSQVLDESSD